MREVYIIDAVRTPVGKMGGTLKSTQAHQLGAVVCKALLERTGVDAKAVEEVVIAQVKQNAKASNIARVVSLMAGIPEEVPSYTLMMQCGSSIQSVHCAANDIRCGDVDVAIAGGVEAMSDTHFELWSARYGYGTGNSTIYDPIVEGARQAQPQDVYGAFGMGDTAENVAEKYGITRQAMDEFALESQRRAIAAIAGGHFAGEIAPVVLPQRKKDPIVFTTDEQPRETTLEALGKLKPVFRTDGKGMVTAGNSCGRSDAGAALLLMSGEKVKELGLKPLARIVGQAIVGVDPRLMGIGPVPAVRKVLAKTGVKLEEVGLFELNEAFAAQSLAVINELGLDREKVNVSGGAIALGHPLGATGGRILTTLVHGMKRTGAKYGIATLCMGGGQGGATLLELVDETQELSHYIERMNSYGTNSQPHSACQGDHCG